MAAWCLAKGVPYFSMYGKDGSSPYQDLAGLAPAAIAPEASLGSSLQMIKPCGSLTLELAEETHDLAHDTVHAERGRTSHTPCSKIKGVAATCVVQGTCQRRGGQRARWPSTRLAWRARCSAPASTSSWPMPTPSSCATPRGILPGAHACLRHAPQDAWRIGASHLHGARPWRQGALTHCSYGCCMAVRDVQCRLLTIAH